MSALPMGTDGNEFEQEGAELPAVPDGPGGGGLVVPSREQMELMLVGANDVESLVDLQNAAATLQDFARRHKAMKAKLAEISANATQVRGAPDANREERWRSVRMPLWQVGRCRVGRITCCLTQPRVHEIGGRSLQRWARD